MCGIAGFITGDRIDQDRDAVIAEMLKALQHRGPDGSGWRETGRVYLGTQRLAIIDVHGGAQPMVSACGSLTLAMNGEIFNYKQLRAELESQGVLFRTKADTEVALEILAREGMRGISRLNGMFAIAFYDHANEKLFLIRDRFGVKPLYWAHGHDYFAFASQVHALRESKLANLEINERALWDFLTLRYVPTSQSVWKSVAKVRPGTYLEVCAKTLQVVEHNYWNPPLRPRRGLRFWTEDDRKFAYLVEDAVNLRLNADVPVGVALSGGLDSSVIASIAVANSHKVPTYCVGFEGADSTNEFTSARAVSDFLGTEHHEFEVTRQQFLDFLPTFASLFDEPMADLTSIPFYFLCKQASKDVKVLLSGEGADEILAGYDFDRVVRNTPEMHLRRFSNLTKLSSRRNFRRKFQQNPLVMTNYLNSREKSSAFVKPVDFPDSLNYSRQAALTAANFDALEQVLYVYKKDWLVEDLLARADRISMANSMEVRTPFLDFRLVAWLAGASPDRKVGVEHGKLVTKRLLRRYARGRLPESTLHRDKRGFSIPVYHWQDPLIVEWIADSVLSINRSAVLSVLRRDFIERMLSDAFAPDAEPSSRHRIWNIVTLEYWLRAWA